MKGPKKDRFEEIFKEGKRAAGSLCRLTALTGTGKVGVATAKKIGNTPQRNKVKRRFREVLRSLTQHLSPKLDYVVMALPASSGAKLEEIKAQLAGLAIELNTRWEKELESS